MRAWRTLALLAASLAAAEQPPAAKESELAAAARREAERRQTAKRQKPARTYGDDDLKRPEAAASPAPGEEGAAAASYTPQFNPDRLDQQAATEPPPQGRLDEADRETADAVVANRYWENQADGARQRLGEARGDLATNRSRQESLRSRLNPMSPSFDIDTNGQLQAQAELTQLQQQEVELREAVDAAEAAWQALQAEARRNGVSLGERGRKP